MVSEISERMIEYLHRNQRITESGLPADLTLLEYLREIRGFKGTKEGCASGDCGACTVVLVSERDDDLWYQTVNSCICPVGELHQRELITVEDLAPSDQTLHPVQQAMVDHHASQCGFCTPGFVMSAFALLKNEPNPDRAAVEQGLAGNLCRCTGYRPIIDAVLDPSAAVVDQYDQTSTQRRAQLAQWSEQPLPIEQGLALPTTLHEVAEQRVRWPDAEYVAGATDLGLEITQSLKRKPRLIGLSRVSELQGISCQGDQVELGAGTTYTEFLDYARRQNWSEIVDLLHRIAAEQIRNRGTLGGNIANASPIGDIPPLLLALDAELALWSPERESIASKVVKVPVSEFFVGYRQTLLEPGELIRSIRFTPPAPEDLFVIEKVTKRHEDDISTVLVVLHLKLEQQRISHARIGLGGMAATPAQAQLCAQWMLGKHLSEVSLQAIRQKLAQEFQPMSDLRASAEYRLSVCASILYEAIRARLEREVHE